MFGIARLGFLVIWLVVGNVGNNPRRFLFKEPTIRIPVKESTKSLILLNPHAVDKGHISADHEWMAIGVPSVATYICAHEERMATNGSAFLRGDRLVARYREDRRFSAGKDLGDYLFNRQQVISSVTNNEFEGNLKSTLKSSWRDGSDRFDVYPLPHGHGLQSDLPLGRLSSRASFPRLPANEAAGYGSDDNQPPVGSFEGCVPLWRGGVCLGVICLAAGLSVWAVRRDNGWLVLFCWLLFLAGSFIWLTGHYWGDRQQQAEYRQPFTNGEMYHKYLYSKQATVRALTI